MTEEKFIELMEEEREYKSFDDDRVMLGINIMRKYIPKAGIEGADHDIIYSVDIDELTKANITEADVIILSEMGWMIEDDCLSHFV